MKTRPRRLTRAWTARRARIAATQRGFDKFWRMCHGRLDIRAEYLHHLARRTACADKRTKIALDVAHGNLSPAAGMQLLNHVLEETP